MDRHCTLRSLEDNLILECDLPDDIAEIGNEIEVGAERLVVIGVDRPVCNELINLDSYDILLA